MKVRCKTTQTIKIVSPSSTRTCSGAVNVNIDEKASKNESGDPQYTNTLPTAQEA